MQDVIDQLAKELARAPQPGFDIASTVASGRTAVRRRRIAAGGAILATALVLGGTAWLVAPGDDGRSSNVAGQPTPTPTAAPASEENAGPLVEQAGGRTVINPDAEVLEQSDFTSSSTGETVTTYRVRINAGEYYVWIGTDGASSFSRPAQGMTLREWVAQSLDGPDISDDGWVQFDELSHLVTVLDGLRIVRQVPNPGLGENFAALSDPTALAEVELDGTTYFLAVRSVGGGPTEAIPYRSDKTVGTLAQFRTFTLNQYATNESGGSEGLR
ncbi:MAG: hypothetical protein NTX33_03755 [Propionibacteriales bacterium]|nr:hypothetical protein [Propionibacteriales bacterium]